MCLIVFAHDCHPRYRLILAANRDEFRSRPSAVAHWWEDVPIFGGRDLVAGGTWLGVGRDGRLAAVTNVRNPADQVEHAPSRGELVVDFLRRPQGVAAYAAGRSDLARFAPFNLLLCDAAGCVFLSNRHPGVPRVSAGVHALSNATLDSAWPKANRVRGGLEKLLHHPPADWRAPLFALMASTAEADDAELPCGR